MSDIQLTTSVDNIEILTGKSYLSLAYSSARDTLYLHGTLVDLFGNTGAYFIELILPLLLIALFVAFLGQLTPRNIKESYTNTTLIVTYLFAMVFCILL